MEVIERPVQADVLGGWMNAGQVKQTCQLDRVAFAFGIELADINDPVRVVDRFQIGKAQLDRFFNFAFDSQQDIVAHSSPLNAKRALPLHTRQRPHCNARRVARGIQPTNPSRATHTGTTVVAEIAVAVANRD